MARILPVVENRKRLLSILQRLKNTGASRNGETYLFIMVFTHCRLALSFSQNASNRGKRWSQINMTVFWEILYGLPPCRGQDRKSHFVSSPISRTDQRFRWPAVSLDTLYFSRSWMFHTQSSLPLPMHSTFRTRRYIFFSFTNTELLYVAVTRIRPLGLLAFSKIRFTCTLFLRMGVFFPISEIFVGSNFVLKLRRILSHVALIDSVFYPVALCGSHSMLQFLLHGSIFLQFTNPFFSLFTNEIIKDFFFYLIELFHCVQFCSGLSVNISWYIRNATSSI